MRTMACCLFAFAIAGAAAAQETATYTYDVHGRLVSASRTTGASTAYAYDDANNRTSKVTTGALALLQESALPAASVDPPEADAQEEEPQDEQKPPQR